jgi:hypothetical protein
VDTRHFELQDLLSQALIALEAGNRAGVEAALRRAMAWVEHDWLATPTEISRTPGPGHAGAAADDDEDD